MRLLVDLVENNELEEGKILIHEMLRGIVMERFKDISSKFLLDEQGAGGGQQPPDPDDVAGTLEDPLIDPNMSREYFFKRFTHTEHEIILKKLGLGQNAPTVSYINGVRYELFTTPLQAEKETIRYIEDGSYEKELEKKKKEKEEKEKQAEAQQKKPPVPAQPKPQKQQAPQQQPQEKPVEKKELPTNESLQIMSEVLLSGRPMVIDFSNGDSRVITIEEAKNALEIYDLLNNENKARFVERLHSGQEIYLEMLDFLMDRVRKGII